jgi:hypothetical protein
VHKQQEGRTQLHRILNYCLSLESNFSCLLINLVEINHVGDRKNTYKKLMFFKCGMFYAYSMRK